MDGGAVRRMRVGRGDGAARAHRRPAEPDPGLAPWEWRGEIRTSCGSRHGDHLHAGPGLGRGTVAQGRVQALPVVEDFDVVEHGRLRLRAGAEADVMDVLLLQ